MGTSLFTKDMTIRHREPGAVGPDGRPTTVVTESDVKGGYRHRIYGQVEDGGPVAVEELVVYLPATATVLESDELLINGGVYEVAGAPYEAWNHLKAEIHHLELRARRSQR